MNEELQRFIVKITTEGFADLKTTLNETNRMLDDMNKNLDKSKKSGDSFFGALVKWTGLVGGLTAAFVALKNTIRGVFDTAYDVVDLYQQEQLLGVEARVLEKYGLVAQRNRGTQADAYSFFGDVNELMGRFQSGKITSDDMYKFTKLGIGFQYKRDSSISPEQELAQNRDAYLRALHTAVSHINPNNADQMSIMKDLIKPKSMQTLFMANDEQFERQMAWGDKWRVLSRDENDLQNAQDLITVEMEWKQTLTHFKVELMPILTKVLKDLEPLIPVIDEKITQMGDWVDKHADDLAKWVEEGVDWLINDLPENLKDIADLIRVIAGGIQPIVDWFVKRWDNSPAKAQWEAVKSLWANITGAENKDELREEFAKKYLSDDSTAGGYWGNFIRWSAGLAGVSFGGNKNTTVNNNNSPVYWIKGGSYFDKDTKINPNYYGVALSAHPNK